MREIKFRAKQINDNNWISGYGVIIGDGFCAIPYTIRGNTYDWKLTTITCDINTLGQYTGLKDKNGKEIYEGDIVRRKDLNRLGKVYFYQCAYRVDFGPCSYLLNIVLDEFDTFIIGNIHDNPELIKEEEK